MFRRCFTLRLVLRRCTSHALTIAALTLALDGGDSWTVSFTPPAGLPQVPVVHLSTDPTVPHFLYAATAGGGIYLLKRTTP